MTAGRVCGYGPCSKTLDGRRASARFCDTACRVAAHRARKRALEPEQTTKAPVGKDVPAVTPMGPPVTLSRWSCGACGQATCLLRTRHDRDSLAFRAESAQGAQRTFTDGVHSAWDAEV